MSAARRRGKGGFRTRLTALAGRPESGSTPDRPFHSMTPVIVPIGGRQIVFRPTRSAWKGYQRIAPEMTRARELGARVEALMKVVALFVNEADLEYVKGALTSRDDGTTIVDLMAAVDRAMAALEIQIMRAERRDGPAPTT